MQTLTVTLPDGTTQTRKTARAYTHVLAVTNSTVGFELAKLKENLSYNVKLKAEQPEYAASYDKQIANYEAKIAELDGRDHAEYLNEAWGAINWCGRYDLAEKALAKFRTWSDGDARIIAVN